MKNVRQIAKKLDQTIYVYYNEQIKQYEVFRLYSKRKDNSNKDESKKE